MNTNGATIDLVTVGRVATCAPACGPDDDEPGCGPYDTCNPDASCSPDDGCSPDENCDPK